MTEEEKQAMLEALSGETDANVLLSYLSIAKDIILDQLYPFGRESEEVPDRYATLQVEIASYKIQKRGAEGEIMHTENGLTRSYESSEIPPAMLRRIIPLAKVVK